jgi:hypothetical protein
LNGRYHSVVPVEYLKRIIGDRHCIVKVFCGREGSARGTS